MTSTPDQTAVDISRRVEAEVATGRSALRLLLLAALTIGVAGMHTLGHADTDHAPASVGTHAQHAHGRTPAHDSGMASSGSEPAATTEPCLCFDPSTACLAVIRAGWAASVHTASPAPCSGDSRDVYAGPPDTTASSRAPPTVGLRLANLSVLRI